MRLRTGGVTMHLDAGRPLPPPPAQIKPKRPWRTSSSC
jgi:hypothetical protein